MAKLMLGIPITGTWSKGHHSECGYSGYWGSVVCAFTDKIKWHDGDHSFLVELEIPENRILEKATSVWMMPKSFAKTKVYRGRSGDEKFDLSEIYFKEYDIRDVVNITAIIDVKTIAYVLDETYRYHTWHCPHFNHSDMTNEDYMTEFRKIMDVFPETNTAVPKQDYLQNVERVLGTML